MAAWSGRPALAGLSASQIPAVPLASAIDGLRNGFLAALAAAADRSAPAMEAVDVELLDARKNPEHDYDYSHEFAAGFDMARAELHRIAGGLA